MAWVNNDYLLKPSVSNGAANEPISKNIAIAAGDSPLVVDVTVVSGTGTLKISDSSDGFATQVVKAKTVSITGAGVFRLTLIPHAAGDQANYPLRNSLKVLVDASSDIELSSVIVICEK